MCKKKVPTKILTQKQMPFFLIIREICSYPHRYIRTYGTYLHMYILNLHTRYIARVTQVYMYT